MFFYCSLFNINLEKCLADLQMDYQLGVAGVMTIQFIIVTPVAQRV